MKTDIINIKIDPITKKKAHRIADEMGFSLSTLIAAYLKQLIKTQTIYFNNKNEQPSEWLINELKQAERDEKAGDVSPTFGNMKNAITWLKDPKAKYINGKNAD